MDDLRSELKDFIAHLKAERAATKEKERRAAWTKYVSLTVVLIAVAASIASQLGGKYSRMGQMLQAQASDQWNFYQAQSIKQHLLLTKKKPLWIFAIALACFGIYEMAYARMISQPPAPSSASVANGGK